MNRRMVFASRMLVAVALAAVVSLVMPPVPAGARTGELVPFFVLSQPGGETFDLRRTARQNTVIVVFWDSYKAMAVRELNFLNTIYSYYQLYGLEIVAVEGKGRDGTGVAEELEKLKTIGTEVSYPVVADPGGKIRRLYDVAEMPQTFILSRRGEILFHLSGFRESDGEVLEHKVKELLGLLPAPERLPGKEAALPAPAAPERAKVTVRPEAEIYDKNFYFGNFYYNRGDKDKALTYYEKCIQVMPEATEVHLRIGQIHADSRRYEDARSAWEKILSYDPDNDEADAKLRQLIRGEF